MMCETSSVASLMVVQNRPGRDESGRTDREVLSSLSPSTTRRHPVAWRPQGHPRAYDAEINATLLTTLGACGDVVRNLMAPPAPILDGVHQRLAADARTLSQRLLPRTRAYPEIWLDGERLPVAPRRKSRFMATPICSAPEVQKRALHSGRQFRRRAANDIGIIALFEG